MMKISKTCILDLPMLTKSIIKPRFQINQGRLLSLNRPLDQQESDFEHRRSLGDIKVSGRQTPIITGRQLQFPNATTKEPRQAWLETLETIEDEKLGIVDLHPQVFGALPRIDVLQRNIMWQENYKKVDYRKVLTRGEVKGYKNKPWKQKGTGRARHGSRTSPIFIDGGAANGPRGPKVKFYMLETDIRVKGLCVALTSKFTQEKLHIVESLNIPTDNPQYIEDLIEARGWGLSVLFINETDVLPENMAYALDEIKQYNAMPVYGLNVFSMLKHETLVLTLPALELIERKLLERIHGVGPPDKPRDY